MSGTNPPRGADLLVQELVRRGVTRVFSLSGNQIMSVFDACIGTPIELVHVRHEAAAVHMADAWGRLTGEPGIALLTAGPGHTNALSALYTAQASESPVVLLSGHAARATLGRGGFQEMPQVRMAGEVTKHAALSRMPESVAAELGAALDLAGSGRTGPVYLGLPEDALTGRASGASEPAPALPAGPSVPDPAQLEALLAAVEAADRPVLIAGPAASRGPTGRACETLAARLGLALLVMDSPRGLRDPALGAASALLARADLALLLGKPVDFALRFGEAPAFDPGCRFVQIDPEEEGLARTRAALADPGRLVLGLHAPIAGCAQALAVAGRRHRSAEWTHAIESARTARPAEWAAIRSADDGPVHPAELFMAVQRHLDAAGEAVLVCDGGEVGQWAQAMLHAPRRITNGPSGAIGAALPYGIAARAAFPEATVVCVSGDGAFGFHPAEIETAVRARLPLVFIVGNDSCWNAENQIQIAQYGPNRTIGCELGPARYDLLAEALGAHGEHVARPAELEPALERAFSAGRPACVDVAIPREAAPVMGGAAPGAH